MFEIESGIPIPYSASGNPYPEPTTHIFKHRKKKYPFDEMKKGDSFSVTIEDLTKNQTLKRIQCSIITAAKRSCPTLKFTTRLLISEKLIRCWRVL